jgi:predicted metal-dependent hydrolase
MNFFTRRATDPFPESLDVSVAGSVVSVRLRRSERARNYTLRVGGPARAPVLTVPHRGSLNEARRFLERHTGWLESQMLRLPEATAFEDGANMPLRGELHRIRHAETRRGTVTASIENDVPTLLVSGDIAHLSRRIIDFLKREARHDLETAVDRHAAALGVRPSALRVRDTSSRWGSCTSTGQLSFSWRLILAPPFVLDYLAAHEVAHLREMNHSKEFWRLCEKLCPRTDEARAWLKRHGPALHAIGAAR